MNDEHDQAGTAEDLADFEGGDTTDERAATVDGEFGVSRAEHAAELAQSVGGMVLVTHHEHDRLGNVQPVVVREKFDKRAGKNVPVKKIPAATPAFVVIDCCGAGPDTVPLLAKMLAAGQLKAK